MTRWVRSLQGEKLGAGQNPVIYLYKCAALLEGT